MTSDALVRGLARNPATPAEVLLDLLASAEAPFCRGLAERRDLPESVQEAMVRHPSREVRCTLAEHARTLPELRSRLLTDPEWRVRLRAFGNHLTDDHLCSLLVSVEDDPAAPLSPWELFDELWVAMDYARRLHRVAGAHPDPRVRLHPARFPQLLDGATREALLADPEPQVRATIAAAIAEDERVMQPGDLPETHMHAFWAVLQRPLSRALVDQVMASGDEAALYFVGPNPSTPPDVVQALLRHPSPVVRARVADRADLSPGQLDSLATDPDIGVRTAVSVHPGLTEQQRTGIDITVSDGQYSYSRHVPGPLDDAVRWARSVNPLLRRRAARHPELPGDLVTQLADDDDRGVRVLLALHHPDAPPSLLLRAFLENRGRFPLPARFPTAGLAAFADHTDPPVRRLVALDPDAGPELVDRLCTDPDLAVRQAMASCPRLPVGRIVALLDNPELAEHAAANPALPVERMRQVVGAVK
ncbi:hypothetical protein GCM10010435_91900 [Winogradskya consettensis]|uniref:Leucine rich repeat variant n=1 Tax=Winogradskya consettensis TaxID=113560 RepID=A0A919W0B4_9ACTN|nr:hypothetical protein [Actinoplanes consettensis]GIM81375.1 hypothetical protein Aco04nite_76260 [Actinoplanes consettensis]